MMTNDKLLKALERSALKRIGHGKIHAAISAEHQRIAKTLGSLAQSHANSDPTLAKCCGALSKSHAALAGHHTTLAEGATSDSFIDQPDGDAAAKVLPSETYTYNVAGGGVTERTRAALRLMGEDASIDPLSKSVWDADARVPRHAGDPLAKRAFDSIKGSS